LASGRRRRKLGLGKPRALAHTGGQAMKTISAIAGGTALLAGALALLAGCATGEQAETRNAPVLGVKGKIVSEDGKPVTGCKMQLYDTTARKPRETWDIATPFSMNIQTPAMRDKFFLRVTCEGYRTHADSRIISETYMADNAFKIDLGTLTLGQGRISVRGSIATHDGAKPKGCVLALYKNFSQRPTEQWEVTEQIAVRFDRENVPAHFYLQVACDGYAKPYKSVVYNIKTVIGGGGAIDLRRITMKP
jgi:hypothetical protein